MLRVAVVGGGPAGLRAAEVLAESGECAVTLFEQKRSTGRKFLVAGRGGLNLTHSEPIRQMVGRYSAGPWARLLTEFDSEKLQKWAHELGSETFIGTSGRIFPREMQAAQLLRRWVAKLKNSGVHLVCGKRLTRLKKGIELEFDNENIQFDRVILALGGASWPQTGSDGNWPGLLQPHGISITPWQPANCGWEADLLAEFLQKYAGQPLKNLAVSANQTTVRGELLITAYGFEGGSLYQLGPVLRKMEKPELFVDFRPDSTRPVPDAKLSGPIRWLLKNDPVADIHRTRLSLRGPRPIAEAISSAGGVVWSELDDSLMLRKLPRVWVCGEMIDWEAPTGGFLLQGCFTTGTVAARGLLRFSE